MARHYRQNCPIALGLDVLGERWTLLIVRELIGGPRRYADLRTELRGIATNLLAERLRELLLPVIQAIATFGLDMVEPNESALTPLNGFLAGILLGFDRRTDLNASYRVDIGDRRFEFAVQQGNLTAADDRPVVTITASVADLITARIGSTPAARNTARKQLTFHGEKDDIDVMRAAFQLT